jgi:hypothetical protein
MMDVNGWRNIYTLNGGNEVSNFIPQLTHLPHHAKPRETNPSLIHDIKIQAYAPLFDFLFHWCYPFTRQLDRDIFVMRILTIV